MSDPTPSGVDAVIEKARLQAVDAGRGENASGLQFLADSWGVSYQAVRNFKRQRWMPLERAKQASAEFGVPLRDLVRSDIRDALDHSAA